MCVHVRLLRAGYTLEQILFLLKFGLKSNLTKGTKLSHFISSIALALSLVMVAHFSTQVFLAEEFSYCGLALRVHGSKIKCTRYSCIYQITNIYNLP